MQLQIITPHGNVLETNAAEILLPAVGGALGVRQGHTKLVIALQAGEIMADKAYRISSGSAEITAQKVTVLVTELNLD